MQLIYGIRKKIRYLLMISDELETLSKDLNTAITISGNDDITKVAKGINHLRLSVIERMESEKTAYDANINLITSLSHDIKTPLTSVIAYIELALEKVDKNEELLQCLSISLDKATHLKIQTNDLFEHFLLHSNGYKITFETVNSNELIVQMLEENLFDLEAKEVIIKRNVSDITSKLYVNINLIYSIFENLFSNINKYADLTKKIQVQYYLKDNYLFVSVENSKNTQKSSKHLSTKIGLNNCKAIMEKHKGKLEIYDKDSKFKVVLCFPHMK